MVLFVAFSDIQIEDWKRHSNDHHRFHAHEAIINQVISKCKKYNVPALFCGDIFDNPKVLSNFTLNHVFKWFRKFQQNNIICYTISGNHDQSESNRPDKESPSYLSMLSDVYPNHFINLDFKSINYGGKYIISGIPYLTSNVGFEKALDNIRKNKTELDRKSLLLIHTDLSGAVDTSGREIESSNLPRNLSKLFKGFDLVLCGHIHKPQALRKNIHILGATHQQRVSDMGTDMNIWLIDDKLKLIPVRTKAPVFIKGPKQDDFNMYIEEVKEIQTEDLPTIKSFQSFNPKKLAKSYLKAKGIKSKSKLNLLHKYLTDAGN